MATPFFECVPRDTERTLNVMRGILWVTSVATVTLFVMFWVSVAIFVVIRLTCGGCTGGLAFILSMPVMAFTPIRGFLFDFAAGLELELVSPKGIETWQRKICNRIRTPDLGSLPVLSVWPQMDEARSWLGGWRRVSNVPYRLWWNPVIFFSLFAVVAVVLTVLLYSKALEVLAWRVMPTARGGELKDQIEHVFLITLILGFISSTKPLYLLFVGLLYTGAAFIAVTIAMILSIVLFSLLALIHMVAMLVAPLLIRSHLGTYGESPIDSWLVDTGVSNSAEVSSQTRAEQFRIEEGGLKHSAIYSHPPALDSIACWLSGLRS